MARKPKTQSSPDAAAAVAVPELATPNEASTPARRGRKPKAAALSSALPLTAGIDGSATDDAGADAPNAGPAKAPGRRGPGRKPKQAAGAEIALTALEDVAEPQGQASPPPEAEASSDPIEDDAPTTAAVLQAEAVADSDPAQPDLDPGRSADEPVQPLPEAGACVPAKPAAHWDRTTDRVQFDWPAIKRAAAQDGPNQGMAKLLVAARAEGAQSRWPF
jgi:hypothetical protein